MAGEVTQLIIVNNDLSCLDVILQGAGQLTEWRAWKFCKGVENLYFRDRLYTYGFVGFLILLFIK